MRVKLSAFIKKYDIYLLALVLYLPFIFLGYGTDSDTYGVLWTGQKFAQTFDYIPSRPPGFLVFETITFFLNSIGGFVLTNLFVMVMAIATLYAFNSVMRFYQIPHPKILTIAMMVHPIFWIEATSTIDFLVAMGFVWIGFALLLKGRWWGAGIAMALGVGSRATSVIAAVCILIFVFLSQPELRKKAFWAAVLMGILGAVMYLPSADFSRWTLNFLRPAVGGEEYWTPYLRIGRFLYKSLFFWGIPVWLMFLFGFWRYWKDHKKINASPYRWLLLFCLVTIIAYEAFYIQIPTEPAYLLPTIPFWLMMMGVVFETRPNVLWVLAALVFISNFAVPNIARPNDPNHATSVSYGLWIETGRLPENLQKRIEYVNCGYQMCPEDILPAPKIKKNK